MSIKDDLIRCSFAETDEEEARAEMEMDIKIERDREDRKETYYNEEW